MKVILQNIIVGIVILLSIQVAFAAFFDTESIKSTPPKPNPNFSPPPGLPIDGSLLILVVIALFFGYLVCNKYILSKK